MILLPLSLLLLQPAESPPPERLLPAETVAGPVAAPLTEPYPERAPERAPEPGPEPRPPADTVAAPAPANPPATAESEIVVTADPPPPPQDPLQAFNADNFEVVQKIDAALVEPMAKAYGKVAPRPVRKALRNFFQNLREPVAAVNFLLQLKVGRALETVGRFTLNSTVGLAGFVDIGKKKPFNSPRRPNGFANTLGFYGVKPGAYFYLPLVGSTTVRDLFGGTIDGLFYPMVIGKPFTQLHYTIPGGALSALDYRIENDEKIRSLNENSANPYITQREQYLARRQAEIDALKGRLAAPVVAPTLINAQPPPAPEPVDPAPPPRP